MLIADESAYRATVSRFLRRRGSPQLVLNRHDPMTNAPAPDGLGRMGGGCFFANRSDPVAEWNNLLSIDRDLYLGTLVISRGEQDAIRETMRGLTKPHLTVVAFAAGAGLIAALAAIDPPRVAPSFRSPMFAGLLSIGRERLAAPLPPAHDSLIPENARLTINERGLDIIRQSEGLRLKSYYLAGQWLVGYGHAATAKREMTITAEHADHLLFSDVRRAEEGVRRLVKVPLNENEFSALVSLAYNMGVGAFQKTQVLKRLNAGDRVGAADAYRHLVGADIKGERVVLAALQRRREAERALFLTRPLRT